MPTHKGFTLIEILIVLLILGISAGFALLAFGDFGAHRTLITLTEGLANTVQLAEQQAILEGSTLRLRFDEGGYDITRGDDRKQPLPAVFKRHRFPKKTLLTLTCHNQPVSLNTPLWITPSGNLTPFQLILKTRHDTASVTLTGQHNGTLSLHKEGA
jgi:general secretion pathway protein H